MRLPFLHGWHERWHERHGFHRHHHHFGRHGHRGFRGFGSDPHGGWPGDPGGGAGGLGPGRKLGSADLQLLILALLAERARHGYELIKELQERSAGYYVPSPGMVYPALSYLEEIGHASVEADGAKKLYTITVAGLEYLEQHRATADAILQQLAQAGQRMQQMREALERGQQAEAEAEEGWGFFARMRRHGRMHANLHAHVHEIRDAMHEVKAALRSRAALFGGRAADAEAIAMEARRLTAILRQAAAEIRGDFRGE